MLLGYISLVVLTFLCAFFSLHYLEKLNDINESIIRVDIPLVQSTESMIESLYSQELYGRRYRILESNQMMELFVNSDEEFKNQINKIRVPLADKGIGTNRITSLHNEYNSLFTQWFNEEENLSSAKIEYGKLISEKQNQLIALIRDVSNKIILDQNQKIFTTSLIGIKAFKIIAIICVVSIIIGLGAVLLIIRTTSDPIIRLKKATREISKGNFDPSELGELARSFKDTAKRLDNLESMYLNASPLTHLPGGIAIENVLKKRLNSGASIAFCLIDLDQFKIFNDHYGYERGNTVIKSTAQLIEKAIEKYGNRNDFIGHIGGDDFVIISTIKQYKKICNFIIKSFDKMIVEFYDTPDVKKGYIRAKSRLGKQKKFPIMTISIAVVTNKAKKYQHHVEVNEVATELKNYAKSLPHSTLMADRRKNLFPR
jgi:diguanylate cyclase (GGDEF)-like protein